MEGFVVACGREGDKGRAEKGCGEMASAGDLLTPEMAVNANTLSGSSSSSSFVDTTSSRSEGERDDDERVRKDLSGVFSGMRVGDSPSGKTGPGVDVAGVCSFDAGVAGVGSPALRRKPSSSSDDELNAIGKKIWRPNDRKEPILMDNDERFCLLPVKYHRAYEYYKMAQASYWTVEEVDLSQDKRDWDKLTKQEKHFISYVLAFFAASDGIVLENLAVRFMQGTFVLVIVVVVGGRWWSLVVGSWELGAGSWRVMAGTGHTPLPCANMNINVSSPPIRKTG